MNSAGLNLKIVLFKRRIEVAESKPSTGRISKAKAKEIELAQEVEAQKKQARQKKLIRLAWDLAALALVVIGAILLLALFGITHGALVDKSVFSLKRWFGFGRFIVAGAIFITGWVLLLWRKRPPERFNLGRLLMVEFGLFTLLGALSAFFNDSVFTINKGTSAGGIVGFGLAFPLWDLIGNLLTGVIFLFVSLLFLVLGFGLAARIEKWAKGELYQELEVGESHFFDESEEELEKPISEETPEKPEKPKRVSKPVTQMELPLSFKRGGLVDHNQTKQEKAPKPRSDELPPLSLLEQEKTVVANQATINMNAGMIEKTLADFGVPAKVIGYRVGPTVTQYAVEPGYFDKGNTEEKQKVRISRISGLKNDLTLALKAERLRIEAPVPGESYVGIEIPNSEHLIVRLRPLLESPEFTSAKSSLAIPLGRGVSGQPVIGDLATMPHLLIAGTTNSGKSVAIAAITMALVMNNHPDDLKLVMVDPKLVELKRFNGLPHLLGEVETDLERIKGVLRWATTEMDNRYRLLEIGRSRNLDTYNQKMAKAGKAKLPKVVIMIDELADLMMNAREDTEEPIVRLAQKARAVGIHLIVATQRPSTDVVTGVIKANFPTRIAFTVASQMDSRVILDTGGAETLLGKGDMLYLHPESSYPVRAQGVLVTDPEIRKVISWWQKQYQSEKPGAISLVLPDAPQKAKAEEIPHAQEAENEEEAPWEADVQSFEEEDSDEALIKEATELVRVKRRASASYLQRHLRLGYPRAAWLIDQLEARGVLGPASSGRREREILIDPPEADGGEDGEA